jgi:hypothetical protein
MMRALTILALLALPACRTDESSSLGVAERFIDQYYVQIDLAAAKGFCTGLAVQKIEEQQRLTAGQHIDESTQKPLVRYKLIETREDGSNRVAYLFQGSVRAPGADTFNPKWLVSTRREGTAWKVSNFSEMTQ